MKKILAVGILAFLASGCTKNQGNQDKVSSIGSATFNPSGGNANAVPFDSPIAYESVSLTDRDQAAEIDGQPVSWGQLRSNDPALIELEQRWSQIIISYVNSIIDSKFSQEASEEGGLSAELFIPQPSEEAKVQVVKSATAIFSGFGHPSLAAKVGDSEISHETIVGESLENSRLYKRLFTQRLRRLDGIVVRRAILKSSKDEGLTMEAFVQEKILKSMPSATLDDVRDYAQRQKISESDLTETMLERLKAVVDQKNRDSKVAAYVASQRSGSSVKINFIAPQDKIAMPALSDGVPSFGAGNGKEMIYIGHWSCENCKESLQLFLDSQKNSASNVKGSFVYYFKDQDREARMSAEAALCVHEQNPEYFWQFIENSLTQESPNSEATIREVVSNIGADDQAFGQCFLSRKHKDVVDNQLKLVKQIGVTRSPILVVDGKAFERPSSLEPIHSALGHLSASHQGSRVSVTHAAGKIPGIFTRIWNFLTALF